MTTKNIYQYRWVVLITSCLINLCIGSLYSWSVFAKPMAAELNLCLGTRLTASDLSIVFSLANCVGPITMILGGYINDRIGPKVITLIGGCMFGAGFILSGFAASVPELIAGYSILGGLGMSFVYGCTIGGSVKFFPEKRGMAGGVATASYGISSVILPFIANGLIERFGIRTSFKVLGIAFMVIIGIGSQLIIRCPKNFAPTGYEAPVSPATAACSDKTFMQMLRDPLFYLLLLMLTCGACAGMMVISQAASLGQSMAGMSSAGAAAAVSVLALFNSGGRLGAGILSDRFGRIKVLRATMSLGLMGTLLLAPADSCGAAVFVCGICLVGISFGAIMGLFPGITADCFGGRYNSVNYGFMFIGFALAGLLGPILMRNLYNAFGDYRFAFFAAAAFTVAGLALCHIFVHLRRIRA